MKVCEGLCIKLTLNALISQRNSPWRFLPGLWCSILHLNLLPSHLLLLWPRWVPNCSEERHWNQKKGPESHAGNTGCLLQDCHWIREGMGQGQKKKPQNFSTILKLTFSWFSIQLAVVNLSQGSDRFGSYNFLFFNILTSDGSLELLILPFYLHHLVPCVFFKQCIEEMFIYNSYYSLHPCNMYKSMFFKYIHRAVQPSPEKILEHFISLKEIPYPFTVTP